MMSQRADASETMLMAGRLFVMWREQLPLAEFTNAFIVKTHLDTGGST